MARRPGDGGPAALALSPRARRVGGWVIAVLLIAGIAVVVGLLGGDADEIGSDVSPSASATTTALAIDFGTALDPVTGEVATEARTDRFAEGDQFAYSVRPAAALPETIYVEVRRTGGGLAETVQSPSPQGIGPGAEVIAFSVPAERLLTDFGPGEYLMLIYVDPSAEPIATGPFHVVGLPASPSASATIAP